MKITAAVMEKADGVVTRRNLKLDEVELDDPREDEVPIRVTSFGVRGTVRGVIHGLEPFPTPGVLGGRGPRHPRHLRHGRRGGDDRGRQVQPPRRAAPGQADHRRDGRRPGPDVPGEPDAAPARRTLPDREAWSSPTTPSRWINQAIDDIDGGKTIRPVARMR